MVDARIAEVAADNRVPEMGAQVPMLVRGLWRHGVRGLRGERSPGAALQSGGAALVRAWAPVVAGLGCVGGLGVGLGLGRFEGALAAVTAAVGVVGIVAAAASLVVAGAIAHVSAPRRRADCQLDSLPHRPGEGHPLMPYFGATGLVEYVPGQVWVAQMPLVFFGAQLGARMVVVRADGGGDLLVYSPIALEAGLRRQVEALGRVRWLVAPNSLHHLFVGAWLAAFPEAEAWAAPGLPARRPDLRWAGVLASDEQEVPWDRSIVDHRVLGGHPLVVDVAMCHRPSGTLLVCDMIQNVGHRPETGAVVAWALGLVGMAARPALPVDISLTLADPEALRRGVRGVLGWDFERVIMAHGRLVERDARAAMIDAFASVLRPGYV